MHYLNLIFTSNIYGGFKPLMTESKYKEESYASIKTKKILNGFSEKLLKVKLKELIYICFKIIYNCNESAFYAWVPEFLKNFSLNDFRRKKGIQIELILELLARIQSKSYSPCANTSLDKSTLHHTNSCYDYRYTNTYFSLH